MELGDGGMFGRDQSLRKEGVVGEQEWTEGGVKLKCRPDRDSATR